MAIRKPKPTSPGRRFATYPDFSEITKTEPEKTLVEGLKKSGGRNARGRKTSRHRGGGAKRLYRKVDFKRTRDGIPAKVAAIEYDPNRTAYIALLHYVDGVKAYILAPSRLQVGATVMSGPTRRDRRRQLPAAGQHADRHRGPQRRAPARAAAASSAARPARRSSSWPRTATWRRCACPRARCAWSARSAARPSARSATPITRTSRSARPAASATWASGRRPAARP